MSGETMEKTVPKRRMAGKTARKILSRGVGRYGGLRREDSAWVVAAAMSMLADGVEGSEAVLAARRCTDAIW